jgi:hemerythrin
MSALFTWKPSYSVGIGKIDGQHKKLVSMLNDLYDALEHGEGANAADKIFGDLVAYTVYHFGEEEQLMQEHNYPGAVPHKNEHEALTRRVLEFKKSHDAGRVSIPVSLATFLQDWLKHHIQSTDHKLGEYLNTQGVH